MDKQTIRDMILTRDDLRGQESWDALTEIEDAIDELLKEHALAFIKYFNSYVSKVNYGAHSVYYKDFLRSVENEK